MEARNVFRILEVKHFENYGHTKIMLRLIQGKLVDGCMELTENYAFDLAVLNEIGIEYYAPFYLSENV